jgi:hypothetical protein
MRMSLLKRYSMAANSSALEQWAKSLPLAQLLSAAINGLDSKKALKDQLSAASTLSYDEIKTISQVFVTQLEDLIKTNVQKLHAVYNENNQQQENNTGKKFQVNKLCGGTTKDFFAGLESRLGESCGIPFDFNS